MKYPNVSKGIKKIYAAEIISIFATITAIGAGIMSAVIYVGEQKNGSLDGLEIEALAATILIAAAAVLYVVGFILNLVGIIKASKDEASFKNAFMFTILGIVASVLSVVLASIDVAASFTDIFIDLAGLFVTIFVIQGIVRISESLHREDMVKKGRKILTATVIGYCIGTGLSLFSSVFTTTGITGSIAAILSVCASLFTLVVYLIYLSYLGRTRVMLDK